MSGRRTPVAVGASLVTGAATALVLSLLVFPGGTESQVTGSLLVGTGVGWAGLWLFSTAFTDRSQRWAAVPAALMATAGACLLVAAPGDEALTVMTWCWPPVVLALVVWLAGQVRSRLSGWSRRLLVPVLAALVVISVGALLQSVDTTRTTFAAPGVLHDVGNHRLHLRCVGEGAPTVVLVNGLSEISDSWAHVTARLGGETRVCTYDRAGQAWSDPVAVPQDGIAAADDLHELLDVAGEAGPFVLAGHSIGGPYAMTYAARYPEQIAGLVLLDSSSPDQFALMPDYPRQYAVMRRAYALLPVLTRWGAGGLLASGSGYPEDVADRLHAMTATPQAARNSRDEVSTIPRLLEQAQALVSLGGKPLVVLTATGSLEGTRGWAAAQDRLATLSTNAVQREVEATHQGVLAETTAAAEAAAAVGAVVDAVRSGERVR